MTAVSVYVVTGDRALKRALVGRLERDSGFVLPPHDGTFDELKSGNLVITTPADCSPAFAAQLTTAGINVVILAPVAREADRARYEGAGAEYVPMLVDTEQLFTAMRRFPHQPGVPLAG